MRIFRYNPNPDLIPNPNDIISSAIFVAAHKEGAAVASPAISHEAKKTTEFSKPEDEEESYCGGFLRLITKGPNKKKVCVLLGDIHK